MKSAQINIIGGGLAGCEAAWQLLRRGHAVHLFEMKPQKYSPAHKMKHLAELVCSNSLKSNDPNSAPGLLKEEMRRLNSLILSVADQTAVAAGSALAVDRAEFSLKVEESLLQQNNFELSRAEITRIPAEALTIIATGPLTSDLLAQSIHQILGGSYLYFYDAIAPIVDAGSINMEKVYWASRYDKGTPDYLNCPLSEEEYKRFRQELLAGEKVAAKSFEDVKHFEGCLPIEVMAARGEDTLAFGPMKPVGLINPHTGTRPYAVVQLRRENASGTLFNLVGFQTKLTWSSQERIFRMIPGLENAQFARMGSIHRNTYIHSPSLLQPTLQLKHHPDIFFAGQITGVEGYMESTAMGLMAGLSAASYLEGKSFQPPPAETAIGALLSYITSPESADNFQPMNINFGILSPLAARKMKKREKHILYSKRALDILSDWMQNKVFR
ncbi:MAG: methylenetetrahydrofolate--tRNA-(uracil(54)-C(5))-methyltransferase (FADH(2)-oxidizing) TrmFO [Deltaproteobacteria bacterium HGW-Deltaproteobacteria-6]|jgi:methylenetetrahydrofolate--tRNA-(uracil-5-)-methyltransferase|nr:MAG: methylenetetrahydrofolate--tRNA-(uracil(54)-C(5))-methyltransferase (FADH(2)-oxidizing) TrmFO [Deltaproteobacteria bacterium HGW-Deltaproteobacteria-6]